MGGVCVYTWCMKNAYMLMSTASVDLLFQPLQQTQLVTGHFTDQLLVLVSQVVRDLLAALVTKAVPVLQVSPVHLHLLIVVGLVDTDKMDSHMRHSRCLIF